MWLLTIHPVAILESVRNIINNSKYYVFPLHISEQACVQYPCTTSLQLLFRSSLDLVLFVSL